MEDPMRPVRVIPPLLLVVALGSLLVARNARTLPLYAARTGNMCAQCHFDPNGGGPRNDFGFMFARNRHSVEADTTGAWKDLGLTNKIGGVGRGRPKSSHTDISLVA